MSMYEHCVNQPRLYVYTVHTLQQVYIYLGPGISLQAQSVHVSTVRNYVQDRGPNTKEENRI